MRGGAVRVLTGQIPACDGEGQKCCDSGPITAAFLSSRRGKLFWEGGNKVVGADEVLPNPSSPPLPAPGRILGADDGGGTYLPILQHLSSSQKHP